MPHLHAQCHRVDGCLGESILPKPWMDARGYLRKHGPLSKRLWCKGVFWDNTTGRLVVKRSRESMVRCSFTPHSPPYGGLPCEKDPWSCGIRHASPVLVIANNEASQEDAMPDSAQDVLIDARILDAVSRPSGCHVDDLCRACPDLTWNQIVLAVDRVSRRNQVQLTLSGRGRDRLALPGQLGEQKPASVSVHGPETAGPGRARHHTVPTGDPRSDCQHHARLLCAVVE